MEIIIAIIASGFLSTLVNCLYNYYINKTKKTDSIVNGLKIILYDRIKTLGTKYISEGQITSDSLEDLIMMHDIYHNDLNGNGFLDQLMSNVKKLPVITK